jgi:dsDNA-specific endonuclease/ATPase MutS2
MESSFGGGGSDKTGTYSSLIATVSELRTDLERAINKIKQVESENQTLRTNYSTIKDELIETRKKYNEVADNYLTTVAEKFEAEKQNEAFMGHIKMQLAEKTKEFESLRDQYAPQVC